MLMIDAAAARDHARQEGADHAEHRGDVEIEREGPIGLRALENRAGMHHARAIEENVDAVGEAGGEFLNGLGREHVEPRRLHARRFQELASLSLATSVA